MFADNSRKKKRQYLRGGQVDDARRQHTTRSQASSDHGQSPVHANRGGKRTCSGVQPRALRHQRSAPISTRYLHTSVLPLRAAMCSGALPSLSSKFVSCPAATRCMMLSVCPPSAAQCSAERPMSSRSRQSAPLPMRYAMHRLLPHIAATCSGVSPDDDGMSRSRGGMPCFASTHAVSASRSSRRAASWIAAQPCSGPIPVRGIPRRPAGASRSGGLPWRPEPAPAAREQQSGLLLGQLRGKSHAMDAIRLYIPF